jgi:hypothetical protein
MRILLLAGLLQKQDLCLAGGQVRQAMAIHGLLSAYWQLQ